MGNSDFVHNKQTLHQRWLFKTRSQGLQALLLQNFKLFTRLALEFPFSKSDMLPPGDVERHRSHPDVLEHGDRLAVSHPLQDLSIDAQHLVP